jgi:hypothetical protein
MTRPEQPQRARLGARRGRLLAGAVLASFLAACGGSSSGSGAAPVSPPATAPTGLPTPAAGSSLAPEAAATQGGKYYAVFLAVAVDVNDPALTTAQERAKALGYSGGVADIGCTPGAREQLKLNASGDYTAFSVLFATKEQAQRLVDAYGSGVVGIAYVTAGCLD